MAKGTQAERLAVVETKVEAIEEKVDDLKVDVKDMHDCLDRTRDTLKAQLDEMQEEYRSSRTSWYEHSDSIAKEQTRQHGELAGKITQLEKEKHKIYMYGMVVLAFAAGAGWIGHIDAAKLLKFIGL